MANKNTSTEFVFESGSRQVSATFVEFDNGVSGVTVKSVRPGKIGIAFLKPEEFSALVGSKLAASVVTTKKPRKSKSA